MNIRSVISFTLILGILSSCGPSRKLVANTDNDSIIVLFDNDVHCAVDGYAAMKALKTGMQAESRYVTTVSCGDFAQGGSLGASSHGRNIVNIMNEVGYDFVTPGNHEFDYGIARQKELMSESDAVCLCCNFIDLVTKEQVYDPYRIVDYGSVRFAFLGVATPYTINSSNPAYFKDSKGDLLYSFCIDNFYDVVQESVDKARKEGADYVVVISHVGDEWQGENGINSPSMIANTYGIDVVLDGHSHHVIPGARMKNSRGEDVLLTSTGTKFAYVGKLAFKDGTFTSELISMNEFKDRDSRIEKVVAGIKEGYRKVAEQVIFTSDILLRSYDDVRRRIVRNSETNLGDFCADAYRKVLDTDVAFVGGGSIRENLPAGDVTFNDIYTMFPFENSTCVAEISGATLLDALEFSVWIYPEEFGGFQQVSGLKYEFDPSIPTPVKYGSVHEFTGISGERRVKKVWIQDRTSGEYVPLDPERKYTIAASSYLLKDLGDGYTMLKECTNVRDTGKPDTEVIQSYVEDFLGCRVLVESYDRPQGRISACRASP